MSNFWERFTKSQTELESVIKNKNRSDAGGKYKYADMGDIIETIRNAFNPNAISFNLVSVPAPDPLTQVSVEAIFSADDGEHRGGPVTVAVPLTWSTVPGVENVRPGNQNTVAFGQAYGFAKRYAAVTAAGLPEVNPEDVQINNQNQPTEARKQPASTQDTRKPQNNTPSPAQEPSEAFLSQLKELFTSSSDFRDNFRKIFLGGVDGPRPKFPGDMIQAMKDRNVPFTTKDMTKYMLDQPDNTWKPS